MYYTYMLRCEDGSLYTGITTDLERRFAEHGGKSGKGAKYTTSRRPVCYEAAWESSGRSEALKLELRIKALSKQEKERLIQGEIPEGLDLSLYININVKDGSDKNINC